MIAKRTTFIVGAGASTIYNLPTGGEVLGAARHLTPSNPVFQAILEEVGSAEALNAFIKTAQRYDGPSIDALIENQPAQDRIGRLTIAGLLGQRLSALSVASPSIDADDDWLRFIVDRMRRQTRSDARHFAADGNVSFVTFNFDRQIEDRVAALIGNIYQCNAEAAEQRLQDIPIEHVHGALPRDPSLTRKWIAHAAKEIRIIHDAHDSKTVSRARDLVRNAEVVCFLGFSFAPENLQTLDLPDSFADGAVVFGTTLGMAVSDVADVRRRFHRRVANAVLEPFSCGDLMRRHDIVRCA